MASERYILVRPPQLPELANVQAGAYVVGYDPATDRTVKINVSALGGGQETDINWRANVPYATGLIVEYGLKLWKSLIDNNLGNLPSEGANWTEVSKAGAGSNITNYTTGVYTYDPTIVLQGGRMYYLLAAKPFESTDFIAELEANQWREINRNNIIGVAYNDSIGSDYYFPNLDDTLIVLTAGTIGIENGNETVFSLTITEPSYVIRTGTGYTAGDFTILPICGGHVIKNAAGTDMPTQPALQFGDGFTVTDEEGKTVVGKNTFKGDISAPTSWDGTLHNIDLSSNAYQTLTVNDGVTAVAIGVTFPEDANEKLYEKAILIDNSNNNSAIAAITFDDNSGAYSWEWSVGDPINGIPANGKAEIHLYNRSATVIKALTDIEA